MYNLSKGHTRTTECTNAQRQSQKLNTPTGIKNTYAYIQLPCPPSPHKRTRLQCLSQPDTTVPLARMHIRIRRTPQHTPRLCANHRPDYTMSRSIKRCNLDHLDTFCNVLQNDPQHNPVCNLHTIRNCAKVLVECKHAARIDIGSILIELYRSNIDPGQRNRSM